MRVGKCQLFPKKPVLNFCISQSFCECGKALIVHKTRTKELATLHIGEFTAKETIKKCPSCKKKYVSEELHSLLPYRCTYGFDVIVYIGLSTFVAHKNSLTIQQELKHRNIKISLRHICYLSKRFIVYLAIAHRQSQRQVKQHMQSKGGYILHLDGTCEGAEPPIFSAIDAISDIVLDNQKMTTENSQCISTLLQRIKLAYGVPLALMSDMNSAISNAVGKIFPGIKHYVCHYHFLRDLGKDLFEHDHSTIRRHIKKHKTKKLLRTAAKQLKDIIDNDEQLTSSLQAYLNSSDIQKLKPITKAYLMVSWVIEAASASDGYGFPFDQPHFDFFSRLLQAYPELNLLKQQGVSILPIVSLQRAVSDRALLTTAERVQQKINIFNKLRGAMRIACPNKKNGLNDEGDTDMKTIKNKVTAFRYSEEVEQLSRNNISYRKMVKQIDKYWDRLFAAPIKVTTLNGEIEIQPQRTNNNLEQSFRFLKSGERKKGGLKNLNKALKAMLADTPLIRNLNKPEYREILLDGKQNLPDRFAEIDIKLVHQQEKENEARWQKYPKRMCRLFKIQNLPQMLVVNQSF